MIDTGPLAVPSAILTDPVDAPRSTPGSSLQRMEERLRRLEDAVAALQETRHSFDGAPAGAGASAPVDAGTEANDTLPDTRRHILPMAVSVLQAPPEATLVPALMAAIAPSRKRPWLLFDTLDELRLIVRMFSDRRYRVAWVTIIVPLSVVFLMIGSSMTIGNIPVVGSVLDKLIDLLLAYFVYKVLTREAMRYRDALAGQKPLG